MKDSENELEPMIIDRGPFFDKTASKNVTALVGKTAYLNCRVRNLGNRTVRISFPGCQLLSFRLSSSYFALESPSNFSSIYTGRCCITIRENFNYIKCFANVSTA